MRSIAIALLLGVSPAAAPDHQHIDIPAQYRGTWALDPKLCKANEDGPAFVRIDARQISFYEEVGYLSLAQLNEVSDPPEFFGKFQFVSNLAFSDEVVRLDLRNGNLLLTRNAIDSTATPSRIEWFRCSAAPVN